LEVGTANTLFGRIVLLFSKGITKDMQREGRRLYDFEELAESDGYI
jgi:hypothetical protein